MTAGPHLNLAMLGGFRAEIGGAPVALPQQRARAMLALLAMALPHRVPRERLRGLLWPDKPEADAQNSLRNSIYILRRSFEACGFRGFGSDRQHVWLDPARVSTDLEEIGAVLLQGRVPSALDHQVGFPASVLTGIEVSDLFVEAVAEFRAARGAEVGQLLDRAVPAARDDEARLRLLELRCALAPLNEAHCRDLIRQLIALGRKADALAAYQRLWTLLDTEFGEEPAIETQTLIVALKQSVPPGPVAGQDLPVIVVRDASDAIHGPDPTGRLRDAVQSCLGVMARFREWRVIDGRYLIQSGTLGGAGKARMFDLALSLRGAAPTQSIGAILTDRHSGQVLWSEALTAVAGLGHAELDRAVRRFATAINLFLTGPERPLPRVADTLDHYELWIEAQRKLRSFTRQGWHEAEQALDLVLSQNPGHVRALAARASIETMRQIAFPGVVGTPDMHRKALGWASHATLADPMDSRAQLALAWACAMSRQFDRAELAFDLAFQHNENDPWLIASALVGFAFCERLDRAAALAGYLGDLGLRLEPFHWSYMATTQFLLGDDAACLAAVARAEDIVADLPAWEAAVLAHSGQHAAARRAAARFVDLARAHWSRDHVPAEREITGWFLSCFPIRNRRHWRRLRDGLQIAGLPVPGGS